MVEMLGTLTINGKSLSDFGVMVTDAGIFNSPEPDIESVSVAGRSGDLHISNHRFKNITISYPAVIYEEFEKNFLSLRSWLMALEGNVRIEDSFRPEHYRTGRFTGTLTPNYTNKGIGSFEIDFDCMPQIWLKSGENGLSFMADGIISNDTSQTALPLIRVYGTGVVTIGGGVVNIKEAGTRYIDLDCLTKQAYEGDIFRNGNIVVNTWPELHPGENTVQLGSGIKKVEVTPRWFEF